MVPPLHLQWRGQEKELAMCANRRVKVLKARELRKKQTKPEERLWWLLRNRLMLGYKFRRQFVFQGFILDFYCLKARLAIELDGKVHLKQKDYDQLRQALIENHGIKMLRFKNEELYKRPVEVLDIIIRNLSLPALSTEWRGGTTRERSESSGG